jgi:hypothetical protein
MDSFETSNQRYRPTQTDEVIRVEDAVIEEIFVDNAIGYVTISYGVMDNAGMIHVNLIRLVVDQDTIIQDQFGTGLELWDLREGMRVEAEFSSVMTRSIPPQSRAYRIMVRALGDSFNVKIDRVVRIDTNFDFLYTGNPGDEADQMRFVITDATVILDREGNRIRLERIRPGQLVRVEHATFQTPSIPPQTTAFRVQVL